MATTSSSGRSSAEGDGPASLPEHVARNVQAITQLHLHAEQTRSRHQRAIESVTAALGRPVSLYTIVALVALWMLGNTLAPRLGLRTLDPAPFFWLQGAVALSALLMTTMVLITQNRLGKLSERRMQLDLQVNLLTEQKTAKLIELVEELRRDLPNVRDRRDSEAELMQFSAEPLQVIAAIEEQVLKKAEDVATEPVSGEAAQGGLPSER